MSALPPKADIRRTIAMSAMCQKQTLHGYSITPLASNAGGIVGLTCPIGSMIGQRTRKRHENDQSDNRDNDYHDDHFWVAEALASNDKRGSNVAVSASGPPSNQPIPKPNVMNRTPARIPRVPKTCRTLSMFAAVINNTSRMRLICLLWSKSGQTRVRLDCPLSAKRRHCCAPFDRHSRFNLTPIYQNKIAA